ncbi:hypothetical protein [Bradyrhizobium elkanii]|uniref:hypothetical protein n=1 Tax=Bradyrhizobium elkanii TaxID=29448 RepID=UPI00159EF766|nr:hypothetical protein [Bradyrhizobium elkanii]
MQSVRPDNAADPIPLRQPQQGIGTIMIRLHPGSRDRRDGADLESLSGVDQEKCDTARRRVTLEGAMACTRRSLERRQLQTVSQRSMLAVVSKE